MKFIHNIIYRSYFLVSLRGHVGYFFKFIKNSATKEFIAISPNKKIEKKYFLSVCVRVKNEARFMPEFLSYYKYIGADHVYIYDNNSDDELKSIIMPFVDAGFVTIEEWPAVPSYPSCYIHFFEKKACESKWVAFVDADEFIVEKNKGDLLNALNKIKSSSLGINWKLFGSSWFEKIPQGLVIKNFINSDVKHNAHVKVVVRPEEVLGLWNSHNFYFKKLKYSINTNGRIFWGTFVRPQRDPSLWINHYVYRSKEDSIRKATQGFVDPQGYKQQARTIEKVNNEFVIHNETISKMQMETILGVEQILRSKGYTSPYL